MQRIEHSCLLIGGFDPSTGAGILADYETCIRQDVAPVCVLSADTIQDSTKFYAVRWMNEEWIKEQIHLILKSQSIKVAKIGIIENPDILREIIELLCSVNPHVKIIWDPISSSSSGFPFYSWKIKDIESFVSKLYLITPNKNEFLHLSSGLSFEEATTWIRKHCNLLIKSNEITAHTISDTLYTSSTIHNFTHERNTQHQLIRGTGCRLASGIASNLMQGASLTTACELSILRLQEYCSGIKIKQATQSKINN